MDILATALRSLRGNPLFSALVIALLALGIGANTAIFGIAHAVLLKPLPYPQPGELVLVRKPPRDNAANVPGGGDMMPDTEFQGWVDAVPKSFRALAAYSSNTSALQRDDGAVRVPTAAVTGEFFPLLGVGPWRGRLFEAADLKPGAPLTAILSYSAWQSRFNGADRALGEVVTIDDQPHTIIGVLPPAFEFTDPVQFWRPIQIAPSAPGELRIRMVRVFGRLLPGTSHEAAQRELDDISTRFWDNFAAGFGPPPPANAGRPAEGGPRRLQLPWVGSAAQLVPLQEQLAQQSRATLWLLLGAVGFVLLIACANIANLQLARTAARRRDIAVRAALGAPPTRLAAELLAENLLLALLGGLAGVLLAWWGTQALQAWLVDYLPRVNPIGVDLPVLGFATALALFAGLAFGLAPAWQGIRIDLLESLKEGSPQASRGGARWRQGLVAFEIALALVLAVNTGLLVRSLHRLYSTELGFRTADVLTANLSLPRRYGSPAQQLDFARRWTESIRALPGVKSAAVADIAPLSPYQQIMFAATLQGGSGNTNASVNSAPQQMAVGSVSSEFFAATGIALRQGRTFTEQDGPDAPAVAIVNEAFVKQYYPQGLTLGAQITAPQGRGGHGVQNGPPPTAAIIGVAADVRPRGFESTAQPMAYFPFTQQPRPRVSAVVHFAGDAATLSRLITQATHKIDAGLALDHPSTLEAQIDRQNAPRRVTLMLTSAFALVAVLLAAVGIFGVMSYTVAQRTQEIGVRMALGADPAAILRWMLRYGGMAVAIGLGAGLILTLATGRLLKTFLVGITALDPAVIAAGVVALGLVGLLACFFPARRATRIDPIAALRND